ncbi:MAG: tRNA (adenosine(37)-N6)-dimethylallyltransferase MiaA [Dehalococcoidia bacterium]
MTSPPLVAIVGPTATGKTALAVRLAEHFGGEIVNADSRQVYRGMDIGTAKPSAAELSNARHHLVDIVDPDEPFSLGSYLDLAHEALDDCWSRGVLPLLTGGTGQYVWALLEGWQVPRVPPDPELRAALEAQAARDGAESLLRRLDEVDPEYGARVDRNNLRRVIRALEVFERTGRPISSCQSREPLDARSAIVGLTCERMELYRRIDERVDAMMAAGLLDEARGLVERGYGRELPAMSGIGYRQICQHLSGELSLEEAVERIKTETHRLARMQYTWFRLDDSRIHWLDVAAGDPYAEALRIVESETGLSGGLQR